METEPLIPKATFTFIETKPQEEIYELCISLKDICGAVATTTKVLSDAKVDIRTSTLFKPSGAVKTGYWTSFIDISAATKNIKEIEHSLSRLDVVEQVKIVKPQPLAFDIIHFPILHGDSPAMIMPIELFSSLFEEVERILQPSGFAAVFYNAGKKGGAHMADLLSRKYTLEDKQLISALIQLTKAIGWGQIDEIKVDLNRPYSTIRIRRCFEAILRKKGQERGCHWTRGFLAGFLSQTVKKPMEAIELKCATGKDEHCEFEIKTKLE
jgi:predicted hydrocarbon binding protein